MRFLRFEMERFGHFTDKALTFAAPHGEGTGLHVVYGPNEAGKSTLLEAVRSLLFGIEKSRYAFLHDSSSLALKASVELAGGDRIHVRRTRAKQSLQGTQEDTGEAVGEEWLAARLSKPSRKLFENVFGISLRELTEGAAALAEPGMKYALFGAGLGGSVRPDHVLSELTKLADETFKPRAPTTKIQARMKAVEEMRSELNKGALLSPEEVLELKQTLDRTKAAADERRGEADALRTEIDRTQALRDGVEPYRALADAREQLAALQVPDGLPKGALARFDRLVDDRERAVANLATGKETVGQLTARRDRIVVDATLRAGAPRVAALVRGLERYRKDRADLERLVGKLGEQRASTLRDLASLRPGWDAARLGAGAIDVATRETIGTLANEHDRIDQTEADRRHELGKVEALLNDAQSARDLLPPCDDVSQLRDLVERWSGYAALQTDLGKRAKELAAARAVREQHRARLNPPCAPGGRDPVVLQVLRAEQVAAFEADLRAIDESIQKARAELDLRERDVRNAERELRAARAAGEAPGKEDLRHARAKRDEAWALVRRAWLENAEVADEARAFEPSCALPEAFERTVAQADGVADRMFDNAELVTKLAEREAQVRASREERERAASLVKQGEQTLDAFTARWNEAWTPCGFVPLPPSAMQAWLKDRATLLEADAKLAREIGDVEELRERAQRFEAEAAAVLGGSPNDKDMPQLRKRATARLEHERERSERATKLELQLASNAQRRIEIRRDLEDLAQRRQCWDRDWMAAVAALELDPSTAVRAVRTVVAGLVDLQARHRTTEELAERVRKLEKDVRDYETAVQAVRTEMMLQPASLPVDVVVETLNDRVKANEKADTERTGLEEQLRKAADEVTRSERQVEQARALVAEVLASWPENDEAGYRALAERAERAAGFEDEIRTNESVLRKARRGLDFGEYCAALSTANPNTLAASLADGKRALEQVEQARRKLDEEAGAVADQLKKADGATKAADLLAGIEEQRADLRDLVDHFVVHAMAVDLLRDAIARFERDHQPALLDRAGRLLSSMTAGRYGAVHRRVDEKIVVVRKDGTALEPEALSTGTREQLFLAIRLAYTDLYRQTAEPLPVVLDDVLANFDDARAASTLRGLRDVALHSQVLLFTCHRRVVELAREAWEGVDVVELDGPG